MKEYKRYETIKEYIYNQCSKINYEPLRTAAFTHTNSVDTCITLLAISRDIPIESAKIAALYHDYAQYTQNCPHADHARLSSIMAANYLKSTQLFTQAQIDEISHAIAHHSEKDKYHSPLCEALKDADVLARFLENPTIEPQGIKKQRLLDACADLAR